MRLPAAVAGAANPTEFPQERSAVLRATQQKPDSGGPIQPHVAEMVIRQARLEEIRDHVLKANFEAVSGNQALGLEEVHRIQELLDEVSPRSVLRDFHADLRRLLGEADA